jgi:hypothetical protein
MKKDYGHDTWGGPILVITNTLHYESSSGCEHAMDEVTILFKGHFKQYMKEKTRNWGENLKNSGSTSNNSVNYIVLPLFHNTDFILCIKHYKTVTALCTK